MNAVFESARAHGARSVWLCVWQENPRAIAFYGKQGFITVGSQIFILGTDRQLDWVMARPL
jgi:ribosomal protein S18 acetylase RimI-like enzyme